MDEIPNISAKMIIVHSTHGLAKKPKPIKGKVVMSTGTIAQ